MSGTLRLEIVTPLEVAYSADVEMVTLPGVSGQIGIYPQHTPLLTRIVPGEMTVRLDGRDESFAIGHGLVEVTPEGVAIATDMAVAVDRIDEARVEEARRQAELRLRERLSAEEVATVNASLARSLAQLRVKQSVGRHRRP